jgi:hypothetical protein
VPSGRIPLAWSLPLQCVSTNAAMSMEQSLPAQPFRHSHSPVAVTPEWPLHFWSKAAWSMPQSGPPQPSSHRAQAGLPSSCRWPRQVPHLVSDELVHKLTMVPMTESQLLAGAHVTQAVSVVERHNPLMWVPSGHVEQGRQDFPSPK